LLDAFRSNFALAFTIFRTLVTIARLSAATATPTFAATAFTALAIVARTFFTVR
jgi:hypothetical protein